MSRSRPKYLSSFRAGRHNCGWVLRYSYIAVVPDFGAPTMKKSGDGNGREVTAA
jgi:hypothetical protein